jgi:hypothetical protein
MSDLTRRGFLAVLGVLPLVRSVSTGRGVLVHGRPRICVDCGVDVGETHAQALPDRPFGWRHSLSGDCRG